MEDQLARQRSTTGRFPAKYDEKRAVGHGTVDGYTVEGYTVEGNNISAHTNSPDSLPAPSSSPLPVFLLSDSSGETAAHLMKAAASQFEKARLKVHRMPPITSPESLERRLQEIGRGPAIVAFTLVVTELRELLHSRVKTLPDVHIVDLLEPLVSVIASCVNQTPLREPRRLHLTDSAYFERMEAINFSVRFDDGKCHNSLAQADLVLIGVSRTSKTPTCMYLAHHYGLKSANIPLILDHPPPAEIYQISPEKIVGLTIDSNQLFHLRSNRARVLNLPAETSYAAFDAIEEELAYAKQIFRKLKCRRIDVTNRAIEETASDIVRLLNKD
jgi:regulator of PEP synthase PpsR (kinase-PPPase family)